MARLRGRSQAHGLTAPRSRPGRRHERRGANRGKVSNEYDLSGLVKRLKELAPEFQATGA